MGTGKNFEVNDSAEHSLNRASVLESNPSYDVTASGLPNEMVGVGTLDTDREVQSHEGMYNDPRLDYHVYSEKPQGRLRALPRRAASYARDHRRGVSLAVAGIAVVAGVMLARRMGLGDRLAEGMEEVKERAEDWSDRLSDRIPRRSKSLAERYGYMRGYMAAMRNRFR